MRLTTLASIALVVCPLAPMACTSAPAPSGEKVVRVAQPIQGGTVDQKDSAVVAILASGSQGMQLCSGTLVAPNLVLSAHHCVADSTTTACGSNDFGALYAASSFAVTTSYDAAAAIFNGGGALPTPDGVTWFGVSSVAVPGQNICGQDLSALTLSAPITGVCPIIPSVDTDVTPGETYTAIGFGITSPNGQTAGTRYDVGGMVVQCAESCNDPTMSATEEWLGGSSNNEGTCEGDSGGPAIDSLGRAIGSVSRGPSNACNQTVYESYFGEGAWIKQVAAQAATAGGYTAAGWVSGGATSNPANGYCSGASDAGTTDGGSATDGSSSSDGGGTSTDAGSGSSDAGFTMCGFATGDASCDACLTASCCSQEQACANDTTCTGCVTAANPPSSCSTNALVNGFLSCMQTSCASPCGALVGDAGAGDGGSTNDGGTTPQDAGATADGGSVDDGGGAGMDAGMDAGGGDDGGPTTDATAADDAGGAFSADSGNSNGCGCKAAGTGSASGRAGVDGAFAFASMALALAFARRRRRASGDENARG